MCIKEYNDNVALKTINKVFSWKDNLKKKKKNNNFVHTQSKYILGVIGRCRRV